MRKIMLGLAAAAALAAPLAMTGSANAAAGGELITNGGFDGVADITEIANTTTDFLVAPYAYNRGADMYDPGRYTIGANPRFVHEAWVDWSGSTDNMLIVNGFQDRAAQKVWSQSIDITPCTTPGSTVSYTFSAHAANILRQDWIDENAPGAAPGANISVTINDQPLGAPANILEGDPNTVVSITGSAVVTTSPLVVTIWNNGTAFNGNDFAIDDISLTQVGECTPPPPSYKASSDTIWAGAVTSSDLLAYTGKNPTIDTGTDAYGNTVSRTGGSAWEMAVKFDRTTSPMTVDLIAGQYTKVGTATITSVAGGVQVTYTVDPKLAKLGDVHAAAAASAKSIPSAPGQMNGVVQSSGPNTATVFVAYTGTTPFWVGIHGVVNVAI